MFLVHPIFGVIQAGVYRGGWRLDVRIILLVVLLYVVPTECTDHTEAYGIKLFESTEWPTLREARIHRNDCLRRQVGEPYLPSATLHKLSILCLLSYDAQRLYALCIPKP